jgi:phosphoserine phosphatase
MNNRLAVFDMDGTVVDSIPMLTELAVQTLMTTFGMTRQRARTEYERTLGLPFVKQLGQIWPNDPLNDEAAAVYEATHRAVARLFPVAPGFAETLQWAAAKGWTTALISSTDRQIIDRMPQILTLGFSRVEGYMLDWPKDRQLARAAKELQIPVSRAHVAYFGDNAMDNIYAQRVGARFQYVTPSSVAAVAKIVMEDMAYDHLCVA